MFWVRLSGLELVHHLVWLTALRVWASLRAGRAVQSQNLLHHQREVLQRRTVSVTHPGGPLWGPPGWALS